MRIFGKTSTFVASCIALVMGIGLVVAWQKTDEARKAISRHAAHQRPNGGDCQSGAPHQ